MPSEWSAAHLDAEDFKWICAELSDANFRWSFRPMQSAYQSANVNLWLRVKDSIVVLVMNFFV